MFRANESRFEREITNKYNFPRRISTQLASNLPRKQTTRRNTIRHWLSISGFVK